MQNQDLAQNQVSLKQSSNIHNYHHQDVQSLADYKLINSNVNSLDGYTPLSGQDRVIQKILGYPVTQTIFDEQGNLILDIGDLITYQAVERAIRANVFNILVDAVYINDKNQDLY